MKFKTEPKDHLKHIWITVFLTFFVGWLNCIQVKAQGTTSLYVGQNSILAAPNPPSGAALSQVAWGCSHKAISVEKYMTYGAKITVNEYFTGSAEVRCDYYYYWYDKKGYMHTNNATTYYIVSCYPVTLTTNPTSMSLNIDETQTISYSYSPSNVSPKPTIRFFSSNTNVATVSQEGRVKAVGSGKATITISNSSGPDATCSVNVKSQQPIGISLPSNLSLVVGESKTINPTIYPSDAQCSLTWTSSDVGVVTVSSSGNVTAKKFGSAYITAKINGYDYSDDCYVIVEKPTLTLKASPSGGMLEQGTTVTLTSNNNDATIYYTLDGRIPNQNSAKYTAPIPINQSLSLKAVAYHSDYNTSNVLTANYEVTSLKVVSMNPENDAMNIGREIIPSVTFNSEIQKGDNFSSIKLLNGGIKEITGERIISGNSIYFVPNEELSTGAYNLLIPQNSIKSFSSGANFAFELRFFIKDSSVETIKKISCGKMLKTSGEFYCWGTDDYYTYPIPATESSLTPLLFYNDILDYNNHYDNHYILKANGTLMGWGWNSNSNLLGDGTTDNRSTPVVISKNVKALYTSDLEDRKAILKTDNTLWAWGENDCGQVGNGTIDYNPTSPVMVLDNVKDVSLGGSHSVALTKDDNLWVWGNHAFIGTNVDVASPLMKAKSVKTISAGYSHVLFLKKDGSAYGFGQNFSGEVGNGTKSKCQTPYKIMSNARYVEAAGWQSIAIKKDGSLWRWGKTLNDKGNSDNWTTPKEILDDVTCAHVNSRVCIALKNDGTLWGMGDNSQGELGNGTKTHSISMIKILDDVIAFWCETGSFFKFYPHIEYPNGIYAMKSDGSLWGWGTREIGDGSEELKLSPTKIMDGSTTKYPESVEIDVNEDKATSLPIGEKLVFQTVIKPSNSSYDTITWGIEDESVATISQRGVVTAKAPGKTTVNLEVDMDGITYVDSHDLIVTEATEIINIQKSNVKVSINNSILYLEDLNGDEHIYVYSTSGICIYNGVTKGYTANIPLHGKGLYLVKVGNQMNKVLNP